MKEYATLDYESEAYKTLRKSVGTISITTRGGDIQRPVEERFSDLIEKQAAELEQSGERLLDQFETSWAGNDFRMAAGLGILSDGIDQVRAIKDRNKKTALQGFLAVAFANITDDRKMRPTAKQAWDDLTSKILVEQSDLLESEYKESDLSKLKAGDFNHVAIDGLAENLGEDFEKYKKIAWLLTK